jgi:hypothetical protein
MNKKLKDSNILPDSFVADEGIEHDVPQPKSVPSGWTFDGVYLNVDGSGSAVTKFTPTHDDFRLYYKFSSTVPDSCTVTYAFGNGDHPSGNVLPSSVQIAIGTAFTTSQPEDDPHYTFNGWYTTAAQTTPFVDGTIINANTTLYTKYTAVELVTVSYAFAADSPVHDSSLLPSSVQITKGTAFTPNRAQDSGLYSFFFWSDDDNNTFENGTIVNEDITLYANYQYNE